MTFLDRIRSHPVLASPVLGVAVVIAAAGGDSTHHFLDTPPAFAHGPNMYRVTNRS